LLGARLAALARQIPKGARVADIGTDHGFMPVYLGKNGVSNRIIATDISPGSLSKARDLIAKEKLEDIIETRLGPGLKVISPGEIDTVVIAGMGGLLISLILEEGTDVLEYVHRLVLQPMNNTDKLRKWLIDNGFAMEEESLVKEGRYIYETIVARPGYQEVSDDIEYEVGFKLLKNRDTLFGEFIGFKINKVENIISRLEKENSQNAQKVVDELSIKLKKYHEVLKCFVQWRR
jgi:tRNA (adenine22-N1)-methyltransferase